MLKLLPTQVPIFWESIKFAMSEVTNLTGEPLQKNLTRLLENLLSEKSVCYIRLNKERKLEGIFVVRIYYNEFTGDKSLIIDCMYSFKRCEDSDYVKMFDEFEELAKLCECKYITTWTINPRVVELCNIVGLKETYKLFSKPIS